MWDAYFARLATAQMHRMHSEYDSKIATLIKFNRYELKCILCLLKLWNWLLATLLLKLSGLGCLHVISDFSLDPVAKIQSDVKENSAFH